jgi:hypothetical protein
MRLRDERDAAAKFTRGTEYTDRERTTLVDDPGR